MAKGLSTGGQRIRSLTTRGMVVPLKFTLGTSAAIVKAVPLLLVDLLNEDGVIGRAYAFCYRPSGAVAISSHLSEAIDLLKGKCVTPFDATQTLSRQFALLGVTGSVRMALSLMDMAMWDAMAQMQGVPLSSLLGSRPKALLAYDSRGLGLMEPDRLAEETKALLESGLRAVKLRLGYPSLSEDLAALNAVRRSISRDDIAIMVDYNQALTSAEAIRRGRELEKEGIYWLEEPIAHEDYEASAALARELRVPLQIGENFNGLEGLLRAIRAQASDYVMSDVARIGGVTGWLHAAGITAAQGIQMSSHLMPEISTHLLCATPTAHWLEYVDWADAIIEEPLKIRDGMVLTSERAGSGISWDEANLKDNPMAHWPDDRIQRLFNIKLPIIQAPMAGSSTTEMAIAVSVAGGLGSLPSAQMTPAQLTEALIKFRKATSAPVNVNFFCHTPAGNDPLVDRQWRKRLESYYTQFDIDPEVQVASANRAPFDDAYCSIVEALRPEVVSFHFGLPSYELLDRVRSAGAKIISSATTVREAVWLEGHGCDAVIAMGVEAGGHRGNFLTDDMSAQVGTMSLLPQVVDAVEVPVIAAGGIADGRGIVAAFSLGAAAVQIGTAYLFSPEAKVSKIYREALENASDDGTTVTNVFTGRPARGVLNRLIREIGPLSPSAPAFPFAGGALAPLRAKAEAVGLGDFTNLWSGQSARLSPRLPSGQLTERLAADALSHFSRLAASTQ